MIPRIILLSFLILPITSSLIGSIGTEAHYFDEHAAPKIKQFMEKLQIPGASVAIIHDNDLVYAEGFGSANEEKNIPVTPETVFGIASISKVFTATAVMQVVENNLLDLHGNITRYLPNFNNIKPPLRFPPLYTRGRIIDPITPFNLMVHYAGLPKEPPVRAPNKRWIPQTLSEFTESLITNSRLKFPPNFRYGYSNPGISILGRILEVLSGEDFEPYMQRVLLEPLEMHTASFSNTGFSNAINAKLAQGYKYKGEPVNRPPIGGIPAGNLHLSVLDAANFIKMYLNKGTYKNHEILKPETIQQMFTIQNADLRNADPMHKGPDQGLVWNLKNLDIPGSPKTARHGGSMVGFSSMLILVPEEKLGVIVLMNIRNPEVKPGKIAKEILAVAREKYEQK